MKERILQDALDDLYEARSGSLTVLQAVTEVLCLRCLCQVLFCGSPDCPPAVSTASWRRDTTGQNTRLLPSPASSSPRCSTRPTAAPQPPSACSTPGSAPRDRPLALRGDRRPCPAAPARHPRHLRRSRRRRPSSSSSSPRHRPGALRAPPRRSGPAAAARPALPGRGWRWALRTNKMAAGPGRPSGVGGSVGLPRRGWPTAPGPRQEPLPSGPGSGAVAAAAPSAQPPALCGSSSRLRAPFAFLKRPFSSCSPHAALIGSSN